MNFRFQFSPRRSVDGALFREVILVYWDGKVFFKGLLFPR